MLLMNNINKKIKTIITLLDMLLIIVSMIHHLSILLSIMPLAAYLFCFIFMPILTISLTLQAISSETCLKINAMHIVTRLKGPAY